MSTLLSRFRRTVLPSTSSSKKHSTDDTRQYNYRKPTKSFNEKSVKSRSSQPYTDAHEDTSYNHYHHGAREKPSRSSSKLSKSSTHTANKSTKTKLDNAALARSNTFTLEDEANFQNGTYPRSKKKEKTPNRGQYRERNADADFDDRKSNGVSKDVFETFYLKRTSKSSHSSKSSNDSIRGADDLAPSRSNSILTSNGKLHSSFNGKLGSWRSDKSTPTKQYLFGSTFDRKAKDEPEKENIYKNSQSNTTNNSNHIINNNTNSNSNSTIDNSNSNSDRFKTITINNLRRSFRDSFLDSAKPAKGREHQQLWFIDVKEQRQQNAAETKDNVENSSKTSNWQPFNDDDDADVGVKYGKSVHRVKRNETFRVDTNDTGNDRRNTALGRRETFRINKDQSPVRSRERSPSVESNSSFTINSAYVPHKRPVNGKPIAVTAPYSASNDTDYQHYTHANDFDDNRYDSVREESPPHYRHSSDEKFHSSRDHSPIRIDRPNRLKPNSTTRTVIEIKPPDTDDIIYDRYTRNKRDIFESRSIPERQSFTDLNTTFERPRANRSFASLRTKLEQSGTNNRYKFNNNNYDTVDGGEKTVNDLYESSRPPRQTEPWRNISSRQLSDDTGYTTNRSFVPYRNPTDKYDERRFTPNTTNHNRTTINIDYNYNGNAKSKNDPGKSQQPHRHAFSIPLTAATKSPMAIKPKSNKNRSVNFPSVECEVRLISPNYDTKPRRKETWRKESKPANDWTFNKDIVIKEIVNGTKCTACKHLCTGFEPHLWRKTCLVCKCPRETHAIYQEQVTSVKERLGLKPTANSSTLDAKQLGYTWIPPGLTAVNKVRQYFESIPDDKVPKINTTGEQYREQQLSYQWPKQDLALNYCNHIEVQHKASYEDFVAGRNEIALDIAYVKDICNGPIPCINCDDDIEQGDLAVTAPKFKDDVLWHPKCFTCSTCDEPLVDLTYCVHDDKIYCERHYAEVLKPRCNACDEEVNESDDAQETDVSNEIQCILPDSFDEKDAASDVRGNIELQRSVPEILVIGSDMDEIVEDGKMGEFIDYIEGIDNDDSIVTDKLQFKEFLDQPKRLRHSSYNYADDKDNEEKVDDLSTAGCDESSDEKQSNDFHSKRCINNRKPNMFALASTTLSHHQLNDECDGNQSAYRPLIRITPTEDERVEQFLHEEHIDNTHRPSCDILIKSKTTQTFDCRDECASEVDSYGSYSRVNSPSSDVNRRESIVSDIGSEPIQFECKQPENPNYDYNREDSSSSYKSNVRFERSQSRYSELEYIKGRDDWKDDYVRCDISEEIDSDNYHHLRRHSEAADTLEYIRGREDWIRNELHRGHQHSLPGIFEAGEPKMLIQDEIDSDEYHHNFFQHEMFRSNSESTKHETKIDDNFGEQFVANKTVGEHVTNDGIAVNLDDVDQQTSKWTHDESDEMNTNQQHSNGDIDVVIEDLITHDTINTDDIEITVFDLTPEPEKNNPFIFISEATDEQRETSTEICLNQSIGPQHQQPIEITISSDEHDINNNLAMDSTDTPSRNVTVNSNQSSINEFLCAEIQSETNTRQRCASESEKDIDFELNYGTLQPLDRNLRAKSESSGLLKPGQRPRRALSFENVDDLVRDVSSGPWLHL